MKKFRCWFLGRQKGALGILSTHVIVVEAETAEAAHLKCYDTHEHISPHAGYPKEEPPEIK